jgi:hypothetical protein
MAAEPEKSSDDLRKRRSAEISRLYPLYTLGCGCKTGVIGILEKI